MKKLVSILLVVIMLSVGVITCSAVSITDRELAISRACELFPEHASTIRNEGLSRYALTPPSQDRVKVFEETRDYSDSLAITYTEFSDGTAFISTADFQKSLTLVDSEIVSNYLMHYTTNLTVYSNYDSSQKLRVLGIEHYIDSISFDNIDSEGTISSDSVDHAYFSRYDVQWWENSTSHAYIKYLVDLPDLYGRMLENTVKFHVGNDGCYVTINGS